MDKIRTIGRRKTSVARIIVSSGSGQITVNKRKFEEYFPLQTLRLIVEQPINLLEQKEKYDVLVNVSGGGIAGQAEAIRLAISRALVQTDEEHKPALKKVGFLTRDPRMVERKKFGRAKARKRFQFSKR